MFAYGINQIAIDLLRQKLKILEKVYLRFGSQVFIFFKCMPKGIASFA